MPHGGPDWGTEGPVSTIYSIQDLGELAARLGSIVTHDRRGNVIWMDDFESGIEQWSRAGHPGYSVTWDSEYAATGGFSCKMVTDNDEDDMVAINKYIGYPKLSKYGMEFSFSYMQNCKYFSLWFPSWTREGLGWPAIRWNASEEYFEYYDEDGNWQEITGLSYAPPHTAYKFQTIKLVADLIKREYVRLIVNSEVLDLSGIKFYFEDVPGFEPDAYLRIRITADASAPATAYINNAIITQNEP